MAPGDPLFDFALALGVGVGGIYIAERRFACVSRLRQGSDESREHDTSSKQAGPPLVKCEGLACGRWLAKPRQRAAASLVFKPANMSQAAGKSTSKYVSSAPYWPSGP